MTGLGFATRDRYGFDAETPFGRSLQMTRNRSRKRQLNHLKPSDLIAIGDPCEPPTRRGTRSVQRASEPLVLPQPDPLSHVTSVDSHASATNGDNDVDPTMHVSDASRVQPTLIGADVDLDLTCGADPATDLVIAETPSEPTRLEGANMWVWDDAGLITLPRFAVDARGATWESERMVAANIALPGGRVYAFNAKEPPYAPAGSDGQPRVIGGGPLRLECVEPYRHWRARFEGTVTATTVEAQLTPDEAHPDTTTAEVVFEVEGADVCSGMAERISSAPG